ncbi:MAG: glycosyltransferase family 2 protein [Ferruginibacter sp.]|nr:glycosyltransferase family 2 protein [Ferruginibacter sp.]
MQLSIIIINYNTFTLTSKCIASIYDKLKDLSFEIVLVDNASVECDPVLFKQQFPEIKLIINETNTGFTGGNNLGIDHATGEYLLLLNSDTELINNAPKICLDYLQEHKEVGMVTGQLTYPNGAIQYNCRRFRTIGWELLEVFPFYKLLPKPKQEALMLHHYFDHQSFTNCDWVWGAFMLFPKRIIKELPKKKLSDDFFMYCEDVLWCWDFKQLGYQIHFLPEAKVMHVHRGSTDKNKLKKVWIISLKNHAKFMKKFYPDLRWYIFAAIYFTKQYGALLFRSIYK